MSRKRGLPGVLSITAAVILLFTQAGVVSAQSYTYGGYISTYASEGIDGYIRQSPTGPDTGGHFLNMFTVFGDPHGSSYVQVGTYQGLIPYYSSTNAVHMFRESVDQCGRYLDLDLGAPPQADYPYYLNYDYKGAHNQACPDGSQSTFYTYEFRKGSFTSVPFFYGQNAEFSGVFEALTELDNSPPEANAYFGCTSTLSCTNQSYGMHYYVGSWYLWNSGGQVYNPSNPPYLNEKQHWWAFLTCASAC